LDTGENGSGYHCDIVSLRNLSDVFVDGGRDWRWSLPAVPKSVNHHHQNAKENEV